MAIIHKVGNPVNKCEEKVIKHLQDNLPNSFHVYHNLELLNVRGHPYEYDLIVFGNFSAWVLEVKGYGGTITGNAVTWKLSNGRFDPNPIPLTNLKARVLKAQFSEFALEWDEHEISKVYVDALIVLCYNNTRAMIDDPQRFRVVHLADLVDRLTAGDVPEIPSTYFSRVMQDMLKKWFGPITRKPCIGDYEIEGTPFNHREYSVTYLARHTKLKTQARVALKVFRLDPFLSKEKRRHQLTLAARSAEVLTLIGNHSRIPQCYSAFTWNDDKFVVATEWVEGPTLRDLLNGELDWSLDHRLEIFRQVCECIAYIHKQGVFHRAILPKNIVIAKDSQVKLVNFDFAKILPKDFSTSWSSVGTKFGKVADERYLAPETAKDPHAVSARSDIFSAGIVLFELVTGKYPFGKSFEVSTIPNLSEVDQNCPTDVDEIFSSMCSRELDDRYHSFDEILFDLAIILPD